MSIILEMLCNSCSSDNCKEHLAEKTKVDVETRLSVIVRCVCSCRGVKI